MTRFKKHLLAAAAALLLSAPTVYANTPSANQFAAPAILSNNQYDLIFNYLERNFGTILKPVGNEKSLTVVDIFGNEIYYRVYRNTDFYLAFIDGILYYYYQPSGNAIVPVSASEKLYAAALIADNKPAPAPTTAPAIAVLNDEQRDQIFAYLERNFDFILQPVGNEKSIKVLDVLGNETYYRVYRNTDYYVGFMDGVLYYYYQPQGGPVMPVGSAERL
jgi:hypothetical protein